MRPGLWAVLETFTTREPAVARIRGSSRPESAKWPRWLVPSCISKPSAVLRRGIAITPALFTRMSIRSWRAENCLAKSRTEARLARSRGASSVEAAGCSLRSSSAACCPRFGSRHASTTCAPAAASDLTASSPMPLLAPVTTIVRPVWSGMSLAVQGMAGSLRLSVRARTV